MGVHVPVSGREEPGRQARASNCEHTAWWTWPLPVKLTPDQLLELKPSGEKTSPKTAHRRERIQLVEQLPAADQRTVLELLDALHESRQRTSRPHAKARGHLDRLRLAAFT